ncbi:hypothetical protein ACA910_013640 [Epithemia clementina (nom. ined.)]
MKMVKEMLIQLYYVLLLILTGTQGQEAPYYTIKKFAPVSYRQDVCDRQRLIFRDELALPEALQGLNLSVVVTNYKDAGSKPFFALNEAGVIDPDHPGLFAIIMDELARRAGFAWRKSYGVVDPIDAAVDGNRTWTDLLEWETQAYDIALGKWDRSLARIKRSINFPEGWYDASNIIVESKVTKKSLNIWSFLLPFQWGVWILIAITVIATGILYFLLDKMNTASDELELDKQPGAAVFYSFIVMTGHFELHPTTTSARLLTFSLTFFALLVASAYTANLVSFLVARNTREFTVTTMGEAVRLGIPVCVQRGVEMDEYLTRKYQNAFFVRKNTEEEVFQAIFEEECEVAFVPQSSFDLYRRKSEINEDCSLAWFGRVERIVPSGMATIVDNGVLCSSLISAVLSYYILEMKQDGFLERTWEDHLTRVGDQYCPDLSFSSGNDNNMPQEDDIESLSIQELAGIFIIHVTLCGVAFLIALGACLRQRRLKGCQKEDDPETWRDEQEFGAKDQLIPSQQSSEVTKDSHESPAITDQEAGQSSIVTKDSHESPAITELKAGQSSVVTKDSHESPAITEQEAGSTDFFMSSDEEGEEIRLSSTA